MRDEDLENQQQGELAGALMACKFAVARGFHSVRLVLDNTAACWSMLNLKCATRASVQGKILRRVLNLLLWSGLVVHIVWVRSGLMPADAISRIQGPVTSLSMTAAVLEARGRWDSVLAHHREVVEYGTLRMVYAPPPEL